MRFSEEGREMATPGFTAEYGLYRSTAHYQSLGSSDGHMQDSGQQPSRSSQVIVAGIDAAIVWGGPPWQRPEPCLPGYSFDPSTAQCVWGGWTLWAPCTRCGGTCCQQGETCEDGKCSCMGEICTAGQVCCVDKQGNPQGCKDCCCIGQNASYGLTCTGEGPLQETAQAA